MDATDKSSEYMSVNSHKLSRLFSDGAAYRTGVQVGDKIIKVGTNLFLLLYYFSTRLARRV